MYRYLVLIPLCLVSMTIGNLVSAGHHGHHGRGSNCCAVCPRCETYCEFTAEETTEEKTCFKIECEEICVPKVVFPWQTKKARHHSHGNCCDACNTGCGVCTCVNNGAWVKTIKKLKKHSYECPTCKYEWTPKKVCCGGCSPCGGCGTCEACCVDGACDAGGVPWQDSTHAPVEAAEPEEAPSVDSAELRPLPPVLGVSHRVNHVKARLAALRQPFAMFRKAESKKAERK